VEHRNSKASFVFRDGKSLRGCVSGIEEVKESLNKRRHALNMCKR